MLRDFLLTHKDEILASTETKSLDLAGTRPSSLQLKQGLPIFYEQLIHALRAEQNSSSLKVDINGMATAAGNNDEAGIARAAGRQDEIDVARESGIHGAELMRLGYTLSHVVHAYGAMCQAITATASENNVSITSEEFHDLNRCLDVAIAGAVTEFQFQKNIQTSNHEVEQLGFLAHELRNALNNVNISIQLIKKGTVGFGGNTGQLLERGLDRIKRLIDRSLTEVRLRVDPKVHVESALLLQVVDQIAITAEVEAERKKQSLRIRIDPALIVEADQHLFYSALSNVIQNAIKYTPNGGIVEIRAEIVEENIIIEVEDECGGLSDTTIDLFAPFEQHNDNKEGLGLGLTIARRAIQLNHGTIDVENLPGKGCIFRIKLPKKAEILPLPR